VHYRTRDRGSGPTTKTEKIPGAYSLFKRKTLINGSPVFQYQQTPDITGYSHSYCDKEHMYDAVGQRGGFNTVSHTKRHSVPVRICGAVAAPVVPDNWPTVYDNWIKIKQDRGIMSVVVTPSSLHSSNNLISTPSGIPSADWSTLVNEVGSQLDGRIQTGQNLLVDLAQLGQTIGMLKNPFNLTKVPRLLRSKSLGTLSKLPANAFLEYKFGWKPVYADLLALRDVWGEVSKHITHLRETVNKFVSLASRESHSLLNPSVGTFNGFGTPMGITVTPVCTEVMRTYCFSLDLRRTEVALHWSKMDQVLSRLGARDIVSALWDLVPYSFVVDWFTHTNRLLEQKPIEWGQYDLRRVGYSTRTQWFVKFNYTSIATENYDYKTTTVSGSVGPALAQVQYDRTPGFPAGTATIGLFGHLTKTQIAEGIALIVQKT